MIASTVSAHHGKDFLVTSSYKTPEKGESFLLLSSGYARSGSDGHVLELEPGLSYGLTNRWSIEFHTHNDLAGGTFRSRAVAMESVYHILGPGENEGLNQERNRTSFHLAVLTEYERALDISPDNLEGRLIAGLEVKRLTFVVNLVGSGELQKQSRMTRQVMFGVKYDFPAPISIGAEYDGEIERSSNTHFTPGIYLSLSHSADLRLGTTIPTGIQNESVAFRTTFIYSL